MERTVFSTDGAKTTGYPYALKKRTLSLTPHTEMNVKAKTLENLCGLGLGKDILNGTQKAQT